jgi:signal peptidase II
MAPMARRRDLLTAAAIALLVIIADQVSKAWAQGSLSPRHEVTVISGWLWFRLTRNSGATLGLLSGHNELFLAASLLVAAAIVVIMLRGNPGGVLGVAGLGAVAGGAISNLIDRIRLGGVVDFIEVHLWPTDFNLADAAIRLGVVLFVVALLLELSRRPRPGGGSRSMG